MPNKTEKDLWIEMSIREICTQAHFAKISYSNLEPKIIQGTDAVFSSIHSFLSHCANVSKMLKANDGENPPKTICWNILKVISAWLGGLGKERENPPKTIGDILGVSKNSDIHNRKFRNHLEHYDERLKKWIRDKGINAAICTYNIGPKSMIQAPNKILVSHYDPDNKIFTFVNKDIDLGILYNEVIRIKSLADNWVRELEWRNSNSPLFPPQS